MALNKQQLRQEAQARRALLAAAAPNAANQAASHFLSAFNLRSKEVVGVYWTHKTELDTRPLLDKLFRRGIMSALPLVRGNTHKLEFRVWKPGDEMRNGAFGISEPLASAALVAPSMLVVPLLAFDQSGHRLGYGAGYYDVTLRALRSKGNVMAAGFAFEGQLVSGLPAEPHDQVLDAIVTEVGVRKRSDDGEMSELS
jgi:5-formyltetrahydrofolate cyclo-ligase